MKAIDPGLFASFEVCRTLGAEDHGTIMQRDTYFEVARGGSSSARSMPGCEHVVQFERTSEPRQREGYWIIKVSDGAAPRSLGYATQLFGANGGDPDAS